MNATRLHFKYTLRQSKLIEERKVKSKDFWKEVRISKINSVPMANKVEFWRRRYYKYVEVHIFPNF